METYPMRKGSESFESRIIKDEERATDAVWNVTLPLAISRCLAASGSGQSPARDSEQPYQVKSRHVNLNWKYRETHFREMYFHQDHVVVCELIGGVYCYNSSIVYTVAVVPCCRTL